MHKQSSNNSKFIFPQVCNNKRITTPKNNFKKINFDINNKLNLKKNSFCKKHQEPFIKYCQICETDLCEYCGFTHDNNHKLIKYADIIPDDNEINLLKQTLFKIEDNYNKLILEIKKWKKSLEEIIFFLEKEINKNEVLNNVNFISEFSQNEITFNSILKFRKISSQILGHNSHKNNNILNLINSNNSNNIEYNMGYYTHTQYNISKALLDLLLNNNIDNSFIYKGNLIIKYLYDCFINNSNLNNNKSKQNHLKNTLNKKYDTNTYSGYLRYDKDEDVFISDNINKNLSNKSKIIEKHIDLKKGSRKNNKRLSLNLYSKNTFDINSNSNNIFNKTMSTSFSSKNLLLNTNFGNSNGIYSKKKWNLNSRNNINNWNNKLNQTDYNIERQLNFDKYEENTKLNDNEINIGKNSKMISNNNNNKINKNKFLPRVNSFNYVNNNSFKPLNIINNDKDFNVNSDNNNKEIITSKYIPEIRTRNLIFNQNPNLNSNSNNKNINSINININKGKIFSHKKLEPNNNNNYNNINNTAEKEEDNKLNNTHLYNKLNETSFQEDPLNNSNNSNILNTTFNQSFSNNYYNLKKNVIISHKKKESNTNIQFIQNDSAIKSTLFNNNINTNLNMSSNKIIIKKNNFDHNYIINPNLPLCLSLELDNNFCKICLINQINKEIELFSFAQDSYDIPLIISFNEKNEVKIGYEADQISTLFPEKTIFNLIKFIGKKYNDIYGMKEIWPFKIYKDEKQRPFFWINLGKKDKKFYAEDLLSIYFKKLFNYFFKKIICEENIEDNNITQINLILVINVPNNFSYIQRKIIEKIFEKQIFLNDNVNNDLYNNYRINLQKIKIENISSIASLCLKPSNNNKIKAKNNNKNAKPTNSLIINIGGAHTNISISSLNPTSNTNLTINKKNNYNNNFTKKNFFTIKSSSSIELGSTDFTDIFVYDCLKEFDKNLYKQCLETPNALAKLRRSCITAEKIFEENSHVEIKVNKLYENYDLKMILNKSDYEKVCDDLYKKIFGEIKKTIKEAKLSEINIDNILLIGNISRSDKMKNLLKTLFKHNRALYNKLMNNDNINNNNDFFGVIGGAIQGKNYLIENNIFRTDFINDNDINNLYSLNDITPMSFGVETIGGMMEFVVEKGTSIPVQKNKYIKIRNDGEKYLEIKIYEGEDKYAYNNKLISSANIDKRNFKSEKVGNNYIEILIKFEISCELNLCVYVLDVKTMKKRYECLIDIDLIKN